MATRLQMKLHIPLLSTLPLPYTFLCLISTIFVNLKLNSQCQNLWHHSLVNKQFQSVYTAYLGTCPCNISQTDKAKATRQWNLVSQQNASNKRKFLPIFLLKSCTNWGRETSFQISFCFLKKLYKQEVKAM